MEAMIVKKYRIESFEWAKIPIDIPKENLVLVVAKTSDPTIHPTDTEYPIRVFKPSELHEAARSLAKRHIGLNHIRLPSGEPLLIEFSPDEQLKFGRYAFTVDANYNPETKCVEALICLPKVWVSKIRRNLVKSVSVEYTWRDERKTEAGTEFLGLIFDKVDLLENAKAGDPNTELHLVESNTHLFEGEIAVVQCKDCDGACIECKEHLVEDENSFFKECHEAADEYMKRLGEPFAGYKDFADCVSKNKNKSNPDAYCGYIKHKVEAQIPEKLVECNEVTKLTEDKVLVESVDPKPEEDKNKKPKGEEAILPTPPVTPTPPLPVIPAPTSTPPITIAAAANITPATNVTVAPPTVMTPETQKLIESQANTIAQQDIALVKLQEAVKTKEAEKIKAVNDAVKDVRKDIITKVESVLPDPTIISRFNKGGQRLAEEIRKVVYEENKKD